MISSRFLSVFLVFNTLKMTDKEAEQLWKLPVMKDFLARNGKYYFDEEQRDEVESSIKVLLDSWAGYYDEWAERRI